MYDPHSSWGNGQREGHWMPIGSLAGPVTRPTESFKNHHSEPWTVTDSHAIHPITIIATGLDPSDLDFRHAREQPGRSRHHHAGGAW
jgi:hypothetical protein